MLHHNALLRRGASMGLCRRISVARLMHCSLDMYMLHVRSDAVAEVLGCFLTFGRRMVPLIRRNPDSDYWPLSADMSVQRRHWYKLSLQMMNIVHLLGFGQVDKDSKLSAVIKCLQEVFGGFAKADSRKPSLTQAYAQGIKPGHFES